MLTFTKGAETMSFDGRTLPVHDPAAVNVAVAYSDGGELYAYDKGIQEKLFRLSVVCQPQSVYDDFDDWLLNVAVGPLNTFTFTDEAAADHTVRLMDQENPLEEVDPGQFSGTITLRKEI